MPRRTSPPRAVSRTATSTSDAAQDHRPRRRARSSRRTRSSARRRGSRRWSSSRRASRPCTRMWVTSRVTVDLPLVPVIEIDRHPPVGVADPGRRRGAGAARSAASQPATQRCLGVGHPDPCDPAATDRLARSTAASAISRARSAPAHGQVTIQRPVSDARWTSTGPSCSSWSARRRRVHATRSATASGHSRTGTRRPRWTSVPSSGRPGALPGPRPADRDLDLDHRHEPVDVGAFEQADLDETHDPDTIREATARARPRARDPDAAAINSTRLRRWPSPNTPPSSRRPSSRRCATAVAAAEPAFLADLERLVNTDCGSYTKAGVDAVGRLDGRAAADARASP